MSAPANNASLATLPTYTESNQAPPVEHEAPQGNVGMPILEGWRLGATIFSLCLGLFLATLETTIISTSLVTISSDLGSFSKSSWVVVAYLLTYTAFLVVFTRLSDIFGRKPILIIATASFMIWSLACGLAQTMTQLIIFRALQGIGGSGIYALAYASILDVVPFRLLGHASGAISMATACASVCGPVIGGAITSNATWRWVFWLNVPTGTIVIALVVFIFPRNIGQQKITKSLLAQIDWPGVLLSLAFCILLTVPLEFGGTEYPWTSLFVIALFVSSAFAFVGFATWESLLTKREKVWKMLPIFPTRLLGGRVIAATILTAFLMGFPFMVTVINLPQRFQVVNGQTAASAGIHILPLLSMVALGAFLAGAISSKKNVSWHMLVIANILTTIGVALLSTLPTTASVDKIGYFYQAILGFGFGMGLACLMVVSRCEVSLEDNAICVGAITQVRTLGGTIGVAVVQAILLSNLRHSLSTVLTSEQLAEILLSIDYISMLDPATAVTTRQVYGQASNKQMRAMLYFAAAAFLASCFVWRKNAADMQALEDVRVATKNGTALPTAGCEMTDLESGVASSSEGCRSSTDQESTCSVEKGRSSIDKSGWANENRHSGINWSLMGHTIPQGHLFNPELSCPSCGYSFLEPSTESTAVSVRRTSWV